MQHTSDQIAKWAARQLSDYDTREPGKLFAEGVTLNVDDGYRIQTAVAELREQRGEAIIGYKVGCTSPKIQSQLGIDHCVTGRLFQTEQHSNGATIRRSQFANLAIEGELAITLAREPTETDFTVEGIPTCVANVFPVIELHHLMMRGQRSSAGELIANNAIHGGFVAGARVSPVAPIGVPSLSIHSDDSVIERCAGLELIATINSSLRWLADVVSDRGENLTAGQIVLTGSIPSLIPISDRCHIRVTTMPFGNVEAHIA